MGGGRAAPGAVEELLEQDGGARVLGARLEDAPEVHPPQLDGPRQRRPACAGRRRRRRPARGGGLASRAGFQHALQGAARAGEAGAVRGHHVAAEEQGGVGVRGRVGAGAEDEAPARVLPREGAGGEVEGVDGGEAWGLGGVPGVHGREHKVALESVAGQQRGPVRLQEGEVEALVDAEEGRAWPPRRLGTLRFFSGAHFCDFGGRCWLGGFWRRFFVVFVEVRPEIFMEEARDHCERLNEE